MPVCYNESQRQATKDAGTIAGLNVQRILNAPAAASLAYGMTENAQGKVAVYDLGGGTFDISILDLKDGIYQVLATDGDTWLGGEDFDQLIINWLVEEFQTENEIDLTGDRMALQRLKEAAEKAKCELSTQAQAEIVLPFISANQSGPQHLNTVLTRTKFEQMIEPLLERTRKPCEDALKDAGLSASDLDDVIAVGGQTRSPKVLETIQKIFLKEPNRSVNPDEVVSIGAAIQTGIMQGEVTDLVLLDVTPHTLGIETGHATFAPIIDRNSSIPTKKGRIFTMVSNHQTDVEVHILQGESSMAHENLSLGRLVLGGLKPRAEVEVTFEVDINGTLGVTSLSTETGRTSNMTVVSPSALQESDLEQMRAKLRLEGDEQSREIRQQRWRVKLRELSDYVRENARELSQQLPDWERGQIESNLHAANKAYDGSIEEMRAAAGRLHVSVGGLMSLPLEDRLRQMISKLVMNPATRLDVSMRFVDGLHKEDLEKVVNSKDIPDTLKQHAKTILKMSLPPPQSI